MGQQRQRSEHSLRCDGRTGMSSDSNGEAQSQLSSPLTPASTSTSEDNGSSHPMLISSPERQPMTRNNTPYNSTNAPYVAFQPSVPSQYLPHRSAQIGGIGNPFDQTTGGMGNLAMLQTSAAMVGAMNVSPGMVNSAFNPLLVQQAIAQDARLNGHIDPHFGVPPPNGIPPNGHNQVPFGTHPTNIPFPIPPTPVPVLTIQDRPMIPPVYNGVNPNYPGVRLLNSTPPVFAVDDFLTARECDFLVNAADDSFTPAPVVGPGAGEVSQSRTSSTCYLAREDLPAYMDKISKLTGKPVEHCELPQVGRYLPTQQYLQHFDAFDLSNEDGVRFALNGGQRTVTVLVYLNDVGKGGHTSFPSLNLQVKPKRGMALVFFPASVDGLLDKSALHAALPAVDTKYVSQVWIRQGKYEGQPSKRLSRLLDHAINDDVPVSNEK